LFRSPRAASVATRCSWGVRWLSVVVAPRVRLCPVARSSSRERAIQGEAPRPWKVSSAAVNCARD
jgi:hypothetical protein